MKTAALFAYHSGEGALIFPHHETGKPVGIKVSDLLKTGWKITDGGCRTQLPRFDAPSIQVAPASRMQALDFAASQLRR